MDTAKLLEVLDKHIDQNGLAKDIGILIVLPFLEQIVKDSENKFDDVAFGWIKEYVEKM